MKLEDVQLFLAVLLLCGSCLLLGAALTIGLIGWLHGKLRLPVPLTDLVLALFFFLLFVGLAWLASRLGTEGAQGTDFRPPASQPASAAPSARRPRV